MTKENPDAFPLLAAYLVLNISRSSKRHTSHLSNKTRCLSTGSFDWDLPLSHEAGRPSNLSMESVPGEVNNPTFGSRTFHPFPRLPTELRLKIWGFTTPSPRVLEIVWSGHSKWATVPQSRPEPYHALRANKEAHDNFLKNWHPFCLQKPEDGTSDPKLPTTYINPSLDTVYIGAVSRNESCFSPQAINALLLLPGIERLQNLACEIVEWNQVTMNPLKRVDRWEIGFFSRFAELENFIIVDYDIDVCAILYIFMIVCIFDNKDPKTKDQPLISKFWRMTWLILS